MIKILPINKIDASNINRLITGILPFDNFLGGGFVPGSAVILAGEPGVGKSTLMLQIANALAKNFIVLYASGEENLGQIKLRADRLGTLNPQIWCSESINLEELYRIMGELNPQFIIIDSLQMLYSKSLKQAPGTPSQMKYGLSSLIDYVKENNKVLIAIGHSTKSGLIAGLMTLQHMVDVVLFMTILDGNSRQLFSKKNRFGPSQISWEIEISERGFIDKNENLGDLGISMEFCENPIESQTIRLNYEKIQELLATDNFINRAAIKNNFRWLFQRAFGTNDLTKINKYDILFKLKK